MCSEPLTVGGGVSIEKMRSFGAPGSKRYVPLASHRADQAASSPLKLGLSGTVGALAGRSGAGCSGCPAAASLDGPSGGVMVGEERSFRRSRHSGSLSS